MNKTKKSPSIFYLIAYVIVISAEFFYLFVSLFSDVFTYTPGESILKMVLEILFYLSFMLIPWLLLFLSCKYSARKGFPILHTNTILLVGGILWLLINCVWYLSFFDLSDVIFMTIYILFTFVHVAIHKIARRKSLIKEESCCETAKVEANLLTYRRPIIKMIVSIGLILISHFLGVYFEDILDIFWYNVFNDARIILILLCSLQIIASLVEIDMVHNERKSLKHYNLSTILKKAAQKQAVKWRRKNK